MSERPDTLERLTRELEDAAARLRGGELGSEEAAALVEECAGRAALAGSELDRRARDAAPGPAPGQGELL